MPFTLATWNINSVRLREGLVVRLMAEEAPDILCLQECKSPVEAIPVERLPIGNWIFREIGSGRGLPGLAGAHTQAVPFGGVSELILAAGPCVVGRD